MGRNGVVARERDGEKPVVTNKAYRRDKSIVPRLYATNPRYNTLPSLPLTPVLGVARGRGREG